jgi:tetratricopeptide (TPR) repeat protein
VSTLVLCCGTAKLQAQTNSGNHCNDDAWRTKVTQHLFSYAYTSPEWQRCCDTILAECPDYAYIWQMKAMPKLKSGLYEDGIKFLDRATALNPDHDIPYRGFMKCIFVKDYEGALVDFDAAEKMSPGNGLMDHTHYFYMGLCHLGLGAPDKAKTFLTRDLEHQQTRTGKGNEHYNSLLYMGICCLQLQQHKEAETWLKASLKAYSRFPEANFYLGLTYAQTGQKDKAISYLQQAKKFLKEGASMNEDNNAYVNYPFQIGLSDIDAAIADISALK